MAFKAVFALSRAYKHVENYQDDEALEIVNGPLVESLAKYPNSRPFVQLSLLRLFLSSQYSEKLEWNAMTKVIRASDQSDDEKAIQIRYALTILRSVRGRTEKNCLHNLILSQSYDKASVPSVYLTRYGGVD